MLPQRLSIVGRCQRPHGLDGEVKLESFTRPIAAIFEYPDWQLADGSALTVASWRQAHKHLLVRFEGRERLEDVETLRQADVFALLPEPEAGSFYWKDLEGMRVLDAEGVMLGTVEGLTEMASYDLMIVKKGPKVIYVPFISNEVIRHVCPSTRTLSIHWSEKDFND